MKRVLRRLSYALAVCLASSALHAGGGQALSWSAETAALRFQFVPLVFEPQPGAFDGRTELSVDVAAESVPAEFGETIEVFSLQTSTDTATLLAAAPADLVIELSAYPNMALQQDASRAQLLQLGVGKDGKPAWQRLDAGLEGRTARLRAQIDRLGTFALVRVSASDGSSLGEGGLGHYALPTSMGSSVSAYTGNSAYQLDLPTPPGPGSLSLPLSLSYSSDAVNATRAGDEDVYGSNQRGAHSFQVGNAGYGWSLNGLGKISIERGSNNEISRYVASFGQNSFELRRRDGVWYTYPASFAKVESFGNTQFRITTRDGMRYVFGDRDRNGSDNWSDDAVGFGIKSEDGGTRCRYRVRELMLSEVRDPYDNRVAIDYARETEIADSRCTHAQDVNYYIRALRPLSAKFMPAGGPAYGFSSALVQFEWEGRPDGRPPRPAPDDPSAGCGDRGMQCQWSDWRLRAVHNLIRMRPGSTIATDFHKLRSLELAYNADPSISARLSELVSVTDAGPDLGGSRARKLIGRFSYAVPVNAGDPNVKTDRLLVTAENGSGGRSVFDYGKINDIPIHHCGYAGNNTTSRVFVTRLDTYDGVQTTPVSAQHFTYSGAAAFSNHDFQRACSLGFEFLGFRDVVEDLQENGALLQRQSRRYFQLGAGNYPDSRKGMVESESLRGPHYRSDGSLVADYLHSTTVNHIVPKALVTNRPNPNGDPLPLDYEDQQIWNVNLGSEVVENGAPAAGEAMRGSKSEQWPQDHAANCTTSNQVVNPCAALHPEVVATLAYTRVNDAGWLPLQESSSGYARNPALFIMDRPLWQVAKATGLTGTQRCVSRTEYAYDGQGIGAAPVRGAATQARSAVLPGGEQCLGTGWSEQWTSYDRWGNPLTSRSTGTGETVSFYDTVPPEHWNQATSWPATFSKLTQVTSPLTAPTRYHWDYTYLQIGASTEPSGQVTRYQYDALGRLARLWQPGTSTAELASVEYEYGDGAVPFRVVQRVRSDRRDDPSDNPSASNDTRLRTVSFYDGLGRLLQTRTPTLGATTSELKDLLSHSVYDGAGRKLASYEPVAIAFGGHYVGAPGHGLVNRSTLDAQGRPVRAVSSSGVTTRTVHRVIADTTPEGASVAASVADTLDANRHRKQSFTDPLGRLYKIVEFSGECGPGFGPDHACASGQPSWQADATTRYQYDHRGQILRVHDAAGNPADDLRVVYDASGRKTEVTDPSLGTWRYAYDAAGRQHWQLDANGNRLCRYYDQLGRIVRQNSYAAGAACVAADAQETYTYDNAGRMVSADNAATQVDWSYTPRNEMASLTQTVAGNAYRIDFAYLENGNRLSITYPAVGSVPRELVSYSYHPRTAQLISAATQHGTSAPDLLYAQPKFDEYGRGVEYQLGNNGLRQRFAYWPWRDAGNALQHQGGRLNWKRLYRADTAVTDTWLNYDRSGNVTYRGLLSASGATRSEAISYDHLDRVVRTALQGAHVPAPENIAYDRLGNILSAAAGSYAYTNPNKPYQATRVGGNTYQFDANGNVIENRMSVEDIVHRYGYDRQNRIATLHSYTSNSAIAWADERYGYDALGRRARVEVGGSQARTVDLIGNFFEVVERNGVRSVKRNLLVDDKLFAVRNDSQDVRFLESDQVGSINGKFDEQGALRGDVARTSWGVRYFSSGENSTQYGFAGQRAGDSIDEYFMGFRNYDPHSHRFLQPDTIIPSAGDPQTLNRYAYARNNPLKFADPSGHDVVIVCGGQTNCDEDGIKDQKAWIMGYFGWDEDKWNQFLLDWEMLTLAGSGVGECRSDVCKNARILHQSFVDQGWTPDQISAWSKNARREYAAMNKIHIFDYGSWGDSFTMQVSEGARRLDALVNSIDAPVTLIGQCKGAAIVYEYLDNYRQPDKVKEAILIALPSAFRSNGPAEIALWGWRPSMNANMGNLKVVNVYNTIMGDIVVGQTPIREVPGQVRNVESNNAWYKGYPLGHTWHSTAAGGVFDILNGMGPPGSSGRPTHR